MPWAPICSRVSRPRLRRGTPTPAGADSRQGRIVDQVTPTTLILVIVLLSSVLAYVPAAIAESKGYNHTTWYWYGFFLSLIALIHVAVLSPTLEAVDDPLGEQRS